MEEYEIRKTSVRDENYQLVIWRTAQESHILNVDYYYTNAIPDEAIECQEWRVREVPNFKEFAKMSYEEIENWLSKNAIMVSDVIQDLRS